MHNTAMPPSSSEFQPGYIMAYHLIAHDPATKRDRKKSHSSNSEATRLFNHHSKSKSYKWVSERKKDG